jgi:3-oxoacyl-[acyl-carrier protein] reductase
VTGASRGIGAGIATRLAKSGAAVALLGRDFQRLANVEADIRASGGASKAITCDVTDSQSVSRAIEETEAALGAISVLVNNAGLGGPFHRATEVSDEEWELLFATNVRSAFWFCRALLPRMASRAFGRIINISSVLGLVGAARSSTYSATKHALIGYTKSIAAEWGGNGITSNAICPGYVLTDMTANHPEPLPSQSPAVPAGRLGTPEDVAELVVMLAREESAYINGAVLTIDGGLTAACPDLITRSRI